MDDDAQLEHDLLLARRLKLAVRLVIYPLLIGALVLALHIRHAQAAGDDDPVSDDPGQGPVTAWTGQIGDKPVAVSTREGVVVHFSGTLRLACDDGTTFFFRDDIGKQTLVRTGEGVSYRPRWEHSTTSRGEPVTYNQDLSAEAYDDGVLVSWGMSLVMTRAGGAVVRCDTAQAHATLQEAGSASRAASPPQPATRSWRSTGQSQVVLTRGGRVTEFDGLIKTRCDDGQVFTLTWHAQPEDIVQLGRTAVVAQTVDAPRPTGTGGGTFTYRARAQLRLGTRAITETSGATVTCRRSSGVTTTCRRAPAKQTLPETTA